MNDLLKQLFERAVDAGIPDAEILAVAENIGLSDIANTVLGIVEESAIPDLKEVIE